jgi:hypothetical protein
MPQRRQQHVDALIRTQANAQPMLAEQKPAGDAHAITGFERARPWQSHQPLRSRDLISAMILSATRAGRSPSMMMDSTPGDQRAACHCCSTAMKQ